MPSPYPVPGQWMWWGVGRGLALYRKGCLLKQGKATRQKEPRSPLPWTQHTSLKRLTLT